MNKLSSIVKNPSRSKVDILVKILGKRSYNETLALQQQIASTLRTTDSKGKDVLLLVEHDPPIYTLGRKDTHHDILVDEDELRKRNVQILKTTRGGAVTWHGPGQLVGYPILDLSRYRKDVRWYVHSIEDVLVRTLDKAGISASTTSDVGVWIQENRKVAAIGISISRWVTMHGFALNVNNDLSFYDAIVPCGLKEKTVTSISNELKKKITIPQVIPWVLDSFATVFGANLIIEEQSNPNSINPSRRS